MMMLALVVPMTGALTLARPLPAPIAQTSAADKDSFFQGTARDLIWTGRVRGDDKQLHQVPPSPTYAADLRKELAQIQVSIDVDRKLDEARASLDDLAIRATRRGYEDRKDVLIEIALARAKLLETLGKIHDARQAVTSVLVNQLLPAGQNKYELVAPTEADTAEAKQIDADARLRAVRERLTQVEGGAKTSAAADKIDEVVRDALARGDTSLLNELGISAIPALEKWLSGTLDSMPNPDLLSSLIRISPSRAAEFIFAAFDRAGPLWKVRVLRAMTITQALSAGTPLLSEAAWIFGKANNNAATARMSVPRWRAVISRLLEDPVTAREALAFVAPIVKYDALDADLQTHLTAILIGKDEALAHAALAPLEGGDGKSTAQPILEAALLSPHADVRAFCASHLLMFQSNTGLLSAASNPDPKVRAAVADSLRPHQVQGQQQEFWPSLGKREREILTTLVSDPDADVRLSAAWSVVQLGTPLPVGVYESIAHDPDPRVRLAAMSATSLDVTDRARIMSILATDPEPSVLEGVDRFIFNTLSFKDSTSAGPAAPIHPAYYPALEARRLNAARSFDKYWNGQVQDLYARLTTKPEGMAMVLRWITKEKDVPPRMAWVVARLYTFLGDIVSNEDIWSRRTLNLADHGLTIDPTTWVGLFELAQSPGTDPNTTILVTRLLVRIDADLSAHFLPIARDASRPTKTRLQACAIAANGRDPSLVPTLISVLDDQRGKSTSTGWEDQDWVMAIAKSLPEESAEPALDAVLADKSIPDAFGTAFAAGWTMTHALDASQAITILDKWLTSANTQQGGVEAALKEIATQPREKQRDWLVRAAHDPRYAYLTLTLIGNMRDPSYLSVLEEYLAPGFSMQDVDAPTAALNALTRYFDDRAADIILKVAGSTPDPELRDQAFKALTTIRKYQEERGRWKDQLGSGEAWRQSVHDLVVMLDDAEAAVRVQAVRGLATLGAKEEMPRIVRMLKDKDELVRKAAEDALGALNAPPK